MTLWVIPNVVLSRATALLLDLWLTSYFRLAVSLSSWYNVGTFVSLYGYPGGLEGLGVDTEAILIYNEKVASDAFNFNGHLQQYGVFAAQFQVRWYWYSYPNAMFFNTMFFYFGGAAIPSDGNDMSTGAFMIVLSFSSGNVEMKMNNPAVWNTKKFDSNIQDWTAVEIEYNQNISDGSFTVLVRISGCLTMTTTVHNASAWIYDLAGENWGVGSNAGIGGGFAAFRKLQVTTGALQCIKGNFSSCSIGSYSIDPASEICLPCLAGSFSTMYGATSNVCISCLPGTYSNQAGQTASNLACWIAPLRRDQETVGNRVDVIVMSVQIWFWRLQEGWFVVLLLTSP